MELPPLAGSEPDQQATPPMSLMGRLFNVFATPGEVFDSIKGGAVKHLNWILPGILLTLVGAIGAWLVLSQPAIDQQLKEMSHAAMEKQFSKMNMPEAQKQEMLDKMGSFGSIGIKVGLYAAPLIIGFASPLLWGLFAWLIGTRMLKGNFGYFKAVEAMGLATMIAVLGMAVKYLLVMVTGNFFASPSLMLLVKEFDMTNPLHTLLAYTDLTMLWHVAVRGVALARLSNASTVKGIGLAFAFWFIYNALMVTPGLLAQMVTR